MRFYIESTLIHPTSLYLSHRCLHLCNFLSGKKYLLDHIMSNKKKERNEKTEKKATSSRAEPYFVSAFT